MKAIWVPKRKSETTPLGIKFKESDEGDMKSLMLTLPGADVKGTSNPFVVFNYGMAEFKTRIYNLDQKESQMFVMEKVKENKDKGI